MKLTRSIDLMGFYGKCERCGSDEIGEGAGSLEITEDKFTRKCACGWGVEVTDVPDISITFTDPDGATSE